MSLALSGILSFAKSVLEAIAGAPPSSGAEILAWVSAHRILLSVVNEVFFVAAILLVPGVAALYRSLARAHRGHAVVGAGIVAVTIPVMAVLAVVHGRLVYPVYGIVVHTPDIAELAVATYVGGLHAVAILHGVAIAALAWAMRDTAFGRPLAWLGFVTAALDVVGSYPDLIGPGPVLVVSAVHTAWLVAVGARLACMRAEA